VDNGLLVEHFGYFGSWPASTVADGTTSGSDMHPADDFWYLGGVARLVVAAAAAVCSANSRADEIWFADEKKPHVGELLEETPHAFIIKFPKEQIRQIKRDKPLEIQLWRERRILWQDTGDYIILSLPKERVASPDSAIGEKAPNLVRELGSVGAQKSDLAGKPAAFTGRVVGKVISHGEPVEGCKVMLVSRGGEAGLITKLFGGKRSGTDAPASYQTATDREGKYAFEDVAVGEYDVFWLPPNETQWTRKLSEKPNLTVRVGETIYYKDIFVP
jgi:hypothetical protein